MHERSQTGLRVAVLVPCYNEAQTIAKVVRDFRAALPEARVFVYDNNSQDRTRELAEQAGAVIGVERAQGKGHVLRRMFADIEADIYVLVDGDDTYDATSAPAMVRLLLDENLDMVSGARQALGNESYPMGHRAGNAVLSSIVRKLFGNRLSDLLSGYRVLSRRFVKSYPALSTGFECETELTVHALELHMPVAEVPTAYKARPVGSFSKLNTFSDGWRVAGTIIELFRLEKPLWFYAVIAALFAGVALALGLPVVMTFLKTGLVPRFPTAILATGLATMACLSLAAGLLSDGIARGQREQKRLAYLRHQAPRECGEPCSGQAGGGS